MPKQKSKERWIRGGSGCRKTRENDAEKAGKAGNEERKMVERCVSIHINRERKKRWERKWKRDRDERGDGDQTMSKRNDARPINLSAT
jgi:hypothetical protein